MPVSGQGNLKFLEQLYLIFKKKRIFTPRLKFYILKAKVFS